MRSFRLAFLAVSMLLAGSVAFADFEWSFNLYPQEGEALPGGTIQYYYDVTNSSSSTGNLILTNLDVTFSSTPPPAYVSSIGFDANPLNIFGMPPGGSFSGPILHIAWSSVVPIGFSLGGNVTLAVGNPGAVPGQRISRPFTASATPEVPTCALGLLSFVPYGIARLRMRKR